MKNDAPDKATTDDDRIGDGEEASWLLGETLMLSNRPRPTPQPPPGAKVFTATMAREYAAAKQSVNGIPKTVCMASVDEESG
jgi:hypothetical protein